MNFRLLIKKKKKIVLLLIYLFIFCPASKSFVKRHYSLSNLSLHLQLSEFVGSLTLLTILCMSIEYYARTHIDFFSSFLYFFFIFFLKKKIICVLYLYPLFGFFAWFLLFMTMLRFFFWCWRGLVPTSC